MATPAQITANQANAQKSTGPRSVEGRSASRFNALKHGIDAASIVIPGEDPADYDVLVAHYHHEYRPQSASESFHVATMLRADWQKRRLQAVEADLYHTVLAESPGNSLAAVLLAESPAAKLLVRVQRQIAAFERIWHRANTEIRRARAQAESAPGESHDNYLDFLCAKPAPGELASFRQSANIDIHVSPPALVSPQARQPERCSEAPGAMTNL
ncbi:MAG: hypothetical protein NTW28_31110 [Candidatus Solibacter sp.]|nr:hypothetical protein [Candidatus Solibacter sp.]